MNPSIHEPTSTDDEFSNDSIVAQATPPGRGGVGIVRVSGPQAQQVAEALIGHCPPPRKAEYVPFYDKEGLKLKKSKE